MQLQIKSLAGELDEGQKKLIRKKFLWFDEHLPNSAVITVGVLQRITKKSNQAFEVVVHGDIPRLKPVYVKVFRNSFDEAINIAKDKAERIIIKNKDKGFKFKFKIPAIRFLGKRDNVDS